jgi:CRP/FNR family transcriptional regulator
MENILKKLTPIDQEYINNSIRKETYKKGEIIHRTDEECKGLITVLSGQMRTYIVSEEGREVTLFRVNSGEVCVLSVSCLMQSITFDVIIEATEDTEISVIPANVVNKVMNENPQVELYLYKAAVDKFSEVMWTMQQILFLKIDQRVAQFLWDEITRKGTATLHITHDEIARYIGSAREVVTKVMKYLSKEKIVELKRGTIEIVDKDKLQKIAM